MSTLVSEARAIAIQVSDEALTVELADGRVLNVPLVGYPRLLKGTPDEHSNWRFIGGGQGIHWPDLDEDISVEGLLLEKRSQESQESLVCWLENRKQR